MEDFREGEETFQERPRWNIRQAATSTSECLQNMTCVASCDTFVDVCASVESSCCKWSSSDIFVDVCVSGMALLSLTSHP